MFHRRKSYMFRMTWRLVNDNRCHFWLYIEPAKRKLTECTFKLSFIYPLFVMLVMHYSLSGMKWLSNYIVWYNIVEVGGFLYWLYGHLKYAWYKCFPWFTLFKLCKLFFCFCFFYCQNVCRINKRFTLTHYL